MPEPIGRDTDLVLAPGEFAFVLDRSKGYVNVIVGPNKTTVSQTDQLVLWDPKRRRFNSCSFEQAIQPFPNAGEGYYIVLENPAQSTEEPSPKAGTPSAAVKLHMGRKVNLPGPAYFPLWPGQFATVIEGHHLRSNQYLIVRVYNDDEAKTNWTKAVMKKQITPPGEPGGQKGGEESIQPSPPLKPEAFLGVDPGKLVMGQLIVINGTEVAFYIPPTGVEVIPDKNGNFVRDAVTLERLEYCVLLDENGNKRFVEGPAVVFPKPTEMFIESNGRRKFLAIELNEISGLYIKVIADHEDADGKHKLGDELFITGKKQAIYFPRPEHAIVAYDGQNIHYAVAVPDGEARYVLDRLSGRIRLAKGPVMLLPDPRREVIVKRVIDPRMVELLYPGNLKALQYNQRLAQMIEKMQEVGTGSGRDLGTMYLSSQVSARGTTTVDALSAADEISRRSQFTPPRTLTLDNRFEGVVSVDVWPGYAVLVVSKTGKRRVVVGPETVLLEYDENLMPMELSTGTPKTDVNPLKTVYLRVQNNRVSDVVEAETRDFCNVTVTPSYRLNFGGDDKEKWFAVENYVKFLTEHLRSLIRNTVKQIGIEEFYKNSISIIRDSVLGKQVEGKPRPGRLFEENGMHVYDVEVLKVAIEDAEIQRRFVAAQREALQQTLQIQSEERRLSLTQKVEDVKRRIEEEQAETSEGSHRLEMAGIKRKLERNLADLEIEIERERKRLAADEEKQKMLDVVAKAGLERRKAEETQGLEFKQAELKAEIEAIVEKMQAVTPEMTSALQAFADKGLVEKLVTVLGPLGVMGTENVATLFAKVFKGTPFEEILSKLGKPAVDALKEK